MDTRAVTFLPHTALPRRQHTTRAPKQAAAASSRGAGIGQLPFHPGLRLDGIGAINAARIATLTNDQPNWQESDTAFRKATVAQAYQSARSTVFAVPDQTN